jgi:hypothetical protein
MLRQHLDMLGDHPLLVFAELGQKQHPWKSLCLVASLEIE